MFSKAKIALSVAIVLGTASGAFAAIKHPAHRAPTVRALVSATAYGAYGSVGPNIGRAAPGLTDDPPGSRFQDAGVRSEIGDPPR